jgi:hypothetical protein
MTRPQPKPESFPCGCVYQLPTSTSAGGFSANCLEVTAIFARYAGRPETLEVTIARTADFDAHFKAQRGRS